MKLPLMLVLRVAVLIALGASAALAVDYLSLSPAFCGAESGCGAVRRSGFGYLPGTSIPMPALGIAAFSTLFTLSLFESRRKLLGSLAVTGGVLGVILLGLQVIVIGALCFLCVIVDVAAIVAGGIALDVQLAAESKLQGALRIEARLLRQVGHQRFEPDAAAGPAVEGDRGGQADSHEPPGLAADDDAADHGTAAESSD